MLGALMGIIPVAVGAGVALKVTEAAFNGTKGMQERRPRRYPRRQVRRKYSSRGGAGMSFGNFSNLGL